MRHSRGHLARPARTSRSRRLWRRRIRCVNVTRSTSSPSRTWTRYDAGVRPRAVILMLHGGKDRGAGGRGRPQPVVAPFGLHAARHRPAAPRRRAPAPGCCASRAAAGTAAPTAIADARRALDEVRRGARRRPGRAARPLDGRRGPPCTSPTTRACAASSRWRPGCRRARASPPCAGKHLYAAHGSRDRITSPRGAARTYAARPTGRRDVAEFTDMGPLGHYLLRRPTGLEPFAAELPLEVLGPTARAPTARRTRWTRRSRRLRLWADVASGPLRR